MKTYTRLATPAVWVLAAFIMHAPAQPSPGNLPPILDTPPSADGLPGAAAEDPFTPRISSGLPPGVTPVLPPGHPPLTSSEPMIGSAMRPGPAIRPGHDIIRQTKLKVLQRHYETVVNELVELEKAMLTAPADQREAMAAKLKALSDFAAKLEGDVEKLDAHPAVVVAPPPGTAFPPGLRSIPGSYSAAQATGAPDSGDTGGDSPFAWCPESRDSDKEWLGLIFDKIVEVAELRIHETYATGALARIAVCVRDPNERGGTSEKVIWHQHEPVEKTPCVRVINVAPGVRANGVRLEFDTTRIRNWQEIDAVELVGHDGSRQWATSAEASSHWGGGGKGSDRWRKSADRATAAKIEYGLVPGKPFDELTGLPAVEPPAAGASDAGPTLPRLPEASAAPRGR